MIRFLAIALLGQAAADQLIPAGTTWKYLDTGAAPSADWTTTNFNDSGWQSGRAPLGYGDKDSQTTTLRFGDDPKNKHITTWLRREFQVDDPRSLPGLNLKLRRDDGAVIHLNGREVARSGMPKGSINASTEASKTANGSGETDYHEFSIPTKYLIKGKNVLAVEVHQASSGSSDISFDLSLEPKAEGITRGPYLQLPTERGITFRWRSSIPSRGTVRYGRSPSSLDRTASESQPTTEHSITLDDLPPSSTWFYSVGSGDQVHAGGDSSHHFTTSPVPGQAVDARIWVLGDCGTADKRQAAVRDAFHRYTGEKIPDLVLLLGDNAYSNGTDSEYQRAIFNIYPKTMRRSPFWSTLGNHDSGRSTDFTGKYPYFDIFTLPTAGEAGGEPSGTEHYYSFDYGQIHFICLDSMTADRSPKGAMARWLESDLASNTSTWTIAFWHHPPYTKGSHDSDTEKPLVEMRETFIPILEEGGVDLTLTGHSHSYERSYLIDGHYGDSSTFTESMKKDGGSGIKKAYRKPTDGPRARAGAVHSVAGSSGKISGGSLDHPAMYLSIKELGSMVIDIKGNELEASFVQPDGKPLGSSFTIPDTFKIIK